jgi:hypothetical protein
MGGWVDGWMDRRRGACRLVGHRTPGSVGHVSGEVNGPPTILALAIAAITAVLTGESPLSYARFHGNQRYELLRNHTPDPLYFSLLGVNVYVVQTDSGAHPASYPTGTGALSLGLKRQGREADHSPPTSAEVKKM